MDRIDLQRVLTDALEDERKPAAALAERVSVGQVWQSFDLKRLFFKSA